MPVLLALPSSVLNWWQEKIGVSLAEIIGVSKRFVSACMCVLITHTCAHTNTCRLTFHLTNVCLIVL